MDLSDPYNPTVTLLIANMAKEVKCLDALEGHYVKLGYFSLRVLSGLRKH